MRPGRSLEAVLDHLAERGLYTLATEPHQYLAEIECRAGRYELAARHAATEIEIKLGAGYEELNALDLYPQALVDALRGDVSSAREYATQGLAWSERGDRLYANCNRAVLGFLELSLGRFAASPRAPRPRCPVPARDGCPGALRHPGSRRRDRGADRRGRP